MLLWVSGNGGGKKALYSSTSLHTYVLSTRSLSSIIGPWMNIEDLRECFAITVPIPVTLVSNIGVTDVVICILCPRADVSVLAIMELKAAQTQH